MNHPGSRRTIVFAGGGTGGHLFPSLAIAEHLPDVPVHFACSTRAIDADILSAARVSFTPLPVQPWPANPMRVPKFVLAYLRAVRQSQRMLNDHRAALVMAMGGFVSAPVVVAANRLRIPVILVNLDSVPGKANRRLARRAQQVFSVYPDVKLPANVTTVGFPLRRAALADADPAEARRQLGLDPDLPTLLVTGASQGAHTINLSMIELVKMGSDPFLTSLRRWQVLHLAGAGNVEPMRAAYQQAGIRAVVLPFCDRMGLAWAAADLAISRAGAGSAAEVAANAVPTVFMPYPYHKDRHQHHNVEPLVAAGGAVVVTDHIGAERNAESLAPVLSGLMHNSDRRQQMRQSLQRIPPSDGAAQLASAAMRMLLEPQNA